METGTSPIRAAAWLLDDTVTPKLARIRPDCNEP
jgi:hypothetical protein